MLSTTGSFVCQSDAGKRRAGGRGTGNRCDSVCDGLGGSQLMERVLVTGAGGFIGHHLVTDLKSKGYWVRGVDLKYPEYTDVDADEFEILDLRRWDDALRAMRGVDHV